MAQSFRVSCESEDQSLEFSVAEDGFLREREGKRKGGVRERKDRKKDRGREGERRERVQICLSFAFSLPLLFYLVISQLDHTR
jgi:hypothetical protein